MSPLWNTLTTGVFISLVSAEASGDAACHAGGKVPDHVARWRCSRPPGEQLACSDNVGKNESCQQEFVVRPSIGVKRENVADQSRSRYEYENICWQVRTECRLFFARATRSGYVHAHSRP